MSLTSRLRKDEDTGNSPKSYVIMCHECIQTSDYFMYDPRGSSPCGVLGMHPPFSPSPLFMTHMLSCDISKANDYRG